MNGEARTLNWQARQRLFTLFSPLPLIAVPNFTFVLCFSRVPTLKLLLVTWIPASFEIVWSTMPEIEPVADFVSFGDEVECMQQDADSVWNFESNLRNHWTGRGRCWWKRRIIIHIRHIGGPRWPLPPRRPMGLENFAGLCVKKFFGVGAMDALMKLEICLTDAKIEEIRSFEFALPE